MGKDEFVKIENALITADIISNIEMLQTGVNGMDSDYNNTGIEEEISNLNEIMEFFIDQSEYFDAEAENVLKMIRSIWHLSNFFKAFKAPTKMLK